MVKGVAQVVGHLGDEIFDLGGSLGLLLLLLAEGQPHGIQTGGQGGQLVAALHRDVVVQIAAGHGLNLIAQKADVPDNPAASQQKNGQKQPQTEHQEDAGAQHLIGAHGIGVEKGFQIAVRKMDGGVGLPVVEGDPLILFAWISRLGAKEL